MKTRKSLMRFTAGLKDLRNCMAWGILSPAMCMLMLGVSAIAQQPTITTIDAPHAGTISGYGTEAIAICPTGQIAGFYAGYSNSIHAYVRATDGTITTFDAPGAGTGAGAIPLPRGAIRAPTPLPATRAGWSRDISLTRAMWPTATCALSTAHSPCSTFRTLALATARAPLPGT